MLRSTRALLFGALLVSTPLQALDYRIETFSEGLENPWAMAFLPDGRLLVTERVGRLRIIEADGSVDPEPVAGLPEAFIAAQAGLMEVALDPDYSDNRWLYLSYAHGSLEANNTRLARARLVDDELHDFEVLFTAQPLKAGAAHYGGRIAFLADKTLVLTLGDGFDWREEAQNPANHLGKIVRLNRDGSVPQDNPLVEQGGAAPEIPAASPTSSRPGTSAGSGSCSATSTSARTSPARRGCERACRRPTRSRACRRAGTSARRSSR